uniref:Uncharacterized protein n=1 Tax=Gasterosteus aculeatus TaxID=69293 RepID=G3NCN9_GASAC
RQRTECKEGEVESLELNWRSWDIGRLVPPQTLKKKFTVCHIRGEKTLFNHIYKYIYIFLCIFINTRITQVITRPLPNSIETSIRHCESRVALNGVINVKQGWQGPARVRY